MPQSRRHERPRSSRLQHSASFRATKPNKASMTLMPAAASICATDALERQLVPPGFECCERELLRRSWCRDLARPVFDIFRSDKTSGRKRLRIGWSGEVEPKTETNPLALFRLKAHFHYGQSADETNVQNKSETIKSPVTLTGCALFWSFLFTRFGNLVLLLPLLPLAL